MDKTNLISLPQKEGGRQELGQVVPLLLELLWQNRKSGIQFRLSMEMATCQPLLNPALP